MFVMGTQGERIGKVIRCDGDETFVVEKGVFFPKDYELRYDHVTDISGGTVRYALTDFLRGRSPEPKRSAPEATGTDGTTAVAAPTAAATVAATIAGEALPRPGPAAERDEIRIPLMREEIGIEKVARESGHVRIHKTVHTEERHFSVPVTREEVEIEHVPIGRDTASSGGRAFEEDTLDVPLYEEEVRVSKHQVLDEEVVVRTIARSEQRQASATLRHEEAEIEDTRNAPGKAAGDASGGTSKSTSDGEDEVSEADFFDDTDTRR
jgi:uncharacterized protein (TIGR02271 family)